MNARAAAIFAAISSSVPRRPPAWPLPPLPPAPCGDEEFPRVTVRLELAEDER
jgi:hypothetical protein